MYCQYCGEMIEEPANKKCLACGEKLMLPSRVIHWRSLLLVAVPALILMLVYLLSRQSVDSATKVTQANLSNLEGRAEILTTSVTDNVAQAEPENAESAIPQVTDEIAGQDGFQLPISLGDIGPQLLAAGAIDYDRFLQIYERAGQALDIAQQAILTDGSDSLIVIGQDNAYFLLNIFWALGLTNQNPLLDEGPLKEYSGGDIGRFASTGGWTIGKKPATELYSSASLVSLTQDQQTRLENVAYNVYRPCCNNHTAFADCNHGMAMLGLLELMAGQGASEDEMFEAAKYMNSFWYPQQSLETAVFFQATMGLDYDEVDGRMAVGPEVFSGSGFQSVHEWLARNGQLKQAPNSGGGCGV